MRLSDLYAISEGYNPDLVFAIGGDTCMNEGANLQAISIKTSSLAKEAKDDMRAAKNLAKSDRKAAIKKYDSAIEKLKQLKKECENIDDDHIAMVFVETFIKTFIPIMAGSIISVFIPGSVGLLAYITGITVGYIAGNQKILDFSSAVEVKMVSRNKAGINGDYDPITWWKTGVTRGETMVKFDRLITSCELAKSQLK